MTSSDSNSGAGIPPAATGGIGFLAALTLAFIVLKITHHLAWSWWWVWAPIWIPTALLTAGLFIALFITLAVIVVTDRGSSAGRHRREKTPASR